MTNTNPKTGIRYGTIYLHKLNSDVANDLWTNGDDLTYRNAIEELREEITAKVEAENDERFEFGQSLLDPCEMADEVDARLDEQAEHLYIEEPTIVGECEGVKYEISHLGGAALLFVLESPLKGNFALCSPCVPGACSIGQEGDYECYTVPESWLAEDF